MTGLIQVVTTCGSQESARQLASRIVAARLAACVQVSGPIESNYRWKNELRVDEEWVCTSKTLGHLRDRIVDFIMQNHGYEVPEILVLPVLFCTPAYLAWAQSEVAECSEVTQ